MKTPSLSRCATFLAAALLALPAFGQSGGYTMTYPSGPLSTLYASGYIRVQAPLARAGHYFTLKWQTTSDVNGPVSSATGYYVGLATTGVVSNGNAAGQLQSLLVAIPTPYPTYTYSGGTYTSVPFSAVRWWLSDSTAGQDSEKHNGTPNANCTVLGDTWTQSGGVPSRYFAIPVSRLSHSLGFCDNGGWTPVSTGYYTFATYSNGTSGTTVSLGWFVGSATGPMGPTNGGVARLDG